MDTARLAKSSIVPFLILGWTASIHVGNVIQPITRHGQGCVSMLEIPVTDLFLEWVVWHLSLTRKCLGAKLFVVSGDEVFSGRWRWRFGG